MIAHAAAQEGQPDDFELRKAWPWWKVKKWTLHVVHRLFKRYGDARGLEAGSPERAFADLWRRHCSAQFLQAQLELLALVPAVRRTLDVKKGLGLHYSLARFADTIHGRAS